ncbi:hypothetical protein [uncultured Mediterranean phage uvMED]|nr:hypothetical protein [uncultured Mediterranean phage uvMED]
MSTLKVDTILKRTGTGTITLGQSGDTISLPTGASLSLQGGSNGQALTTNGSGTLSFASVSGNAGTEIVYADRSGNQSSIADNVDTKVLYTTEQYDPDSNWDTSNSRYIAPADGRYYFYAQAYVWGTIAALHSYFYKNGSYVADTYDIKNSNLSGTVELTARASAIFNLSQNDYVEFYIKSNTSSGTSVIDQVGTQFLAFRLD